MNSRFAATILLSSLTLSGCVSSTQQTAQNMAAQRERCHAFGFQPGTQGFADCMMTLSMQQSELRQRTFETIWSGSKSD